MVAEGGVVVLTGAGVSVESGVPDFRGGGGLWERFNPMEYATIEAFRSRPQKVWEMFRAVQELLAGVEPNAAHRALAGMEGAGLVDAVVTQNIDGLHRRAGSREVVAFHGRADILHCIWCGARYALAARRPESDGVPWCDCGRPLKPEVVLFGEQLPEDAVQRAQQHVLAARTLLIVGTSGDVAPANQLPDAARARGTRIVEINPHHAAFASAAEDVWIPEAAAEVLPALLAALEAGKAR